MLDILRTADFEGLCRINRTLPVGYKQIVEGPRYGVGEEGVTMIVAAAMKRSDDVAGDSKHGTN